MRQIDRAIDCSTWVGNWAFRYLRYGNINTLKERLTKYNIVKAYVSPIEAILEQDPMRANYHLFNSIDDINDNFFSPVPIIDLSFANWEEVIEFAAKRDDVKMLKLIPNYHMYQLDEEKLEGLVHYTLKYGLIISIQIRIEDLRGHHPLMKVKDVDIIQIVKVLSNFPQQKFIINNAYLNEVVQVLGVLENAYVDISSVETQDVFLRLCPKYGLDRLLFSTNSAFYYPEGNVFKLAYSGLEQNNLNKIACGNVEALVL